jgi:hypothetical protein
VIHAAGTSGTVGALSVGGARGTVGVHECATDSTGTAMEWLTHRPPQGGVLIAAMMSWSMSGCHCSIADGEACGLGGLWRS